MDETDFLDLLRLPPGADLDTTEASFAAFLREWLRQAPELCDDKKIAQGEEFLRSLHARYFQYALQWAAAAMKNAKGKNHPDAQKLKIAARDALSNLQDAIAQFAVISMRINWYEAIIRQDIAHAEATPSEHMSMAQWDPDAAIMIERNRARKRDLMVDNARMIAMADTLTQAESHLSDMRGALTALYGADAAETKTPMPAGIRMGDFEKARKALKTTANGAKKQDAAAQKILVDQGTKLIELIEKNVLSLIDAEKKLRLSPIEARNAIAANNQELTRVRAFLTKYHIPYMRYQAEAVSYLRTKLTVIGSIESLLALHKRMVMGIALPIADMRESRLFESEIVNRAAYLLSAQFSEAPRIMIRAQDALDECRKSIAEHEELMTLDIGGEPHKENAA